ncbi:MAG: hypothetical protein WHV64_11950 [Geminicoccaceae bacterium]
MQFFGRLAIESRENVEGLQRNRTGTAGLARQDPTPQPLQIGIRDILREAPEAVDPFVGETGPGRSLSFLSFLAHAAAPFLDGFDRHGLTVALLATQLFGDVETHPTVQVE